MARFDSFLDALADRVADKVLSKLQIPPPADPGIYTTMNLPPDCPSRDRFHEVVRDVPGAVKAGRVWMCQKEDWHAARRKPYEVPEPLPSDDDIIADSLAAVGIRITRR